MFEELKYLDYKVTEIQGRYITNAHVHDFLQQLNSSFNLKKLGDSVKGKPIYGLTIGTGPIRILMWSQMHGNESTTTKSILDLINYISLNVGETDTILKSCTLMIIPILNPDGADAYTRVNANQIDLNRDAQNCSQPESKILRAVYEDFKPNFCFNLHDQRTIFNVAETNKPATVSFLAPAFDAARNISESRMLSMQVIAAMNLKLQNLIPGQVGRYDDGFNANCVGDAFQMLATPTILFEAGHFDQDYKREITREYIFIAIIEAINTIVNGGLTKFTLEDYQRIPENNKLFYDILITNAHVMNDDFEPGTKIGVLFHEKLVNGKIVFEPKVNAKFNDEDVVFGHKQKDASILADRQWLKELGIVPFLS